MQLKKSEKRMLLFLGIVAGAALIFQFTGKKDAATSSKIKSVIAATGSDSKDNVSRVPSSGELADYSQWGRNPFEDVQKSSELTYTEIKTTLHLKGILWRQGKPFALINDHILAEGETEGGIRIVSITNSTVVCQSHGRTFTLEWKG